MDWTDRHCRVFHRLMTRRGRLYTEMLTTGAIIHLAPTGKDELGSTPSSAGSTGWVNQSYSNKPAPKTTTTGTQFNPEQLPRSIQPK